MRVALAALLAVLAIAPAAAAAPWRPDVEAAERYATQRAGVVTFAVRTKTGRWGHLRARRTQAASTVKSLLALAYLRRQSTRRRALTTRDHRLLGPMIRRSDNGTATAVRNLVGYPRLERVAARAGMREFATAPLWGASLTSARDLARLFWELERLTPRRHRRYLMRLHRTIVPRQRWGVGAAQPPGWDLYFKGGWGDGSGTVDHQGALLVRGKRRVAFAITTTRNPSHEYGKATLKGVARRLLRGL